MSHTHLNNFVPISIFPVFLQPVLPNKMGQLVRSMLVSRRSKELFKTLQKVKVNINPFDEKSTTARYVRPPFWNVPELFSFVCVSVFSPVSY